MNNVKTINDDLLVDIALMSKGEQAARLYLGKKQQQKNDRDELKTIILFGVGMFAPLLPLLLLIGA